MIKIDLIQSNLDYNHMGFHSSDCFIGQLCGGHEWHFNLYMEDHKRLGHNLDPKLLEMGEEQLRELKKKYGITKSQAKKIEKAYISARDCNHDVNMGVRKALFQIKLLNQGCTA